MTTTALRLAASTSLITFILIGFAGAIRTAHADGPLDLSGLSGLATLREWTGAPVIPTATAPPIPSAEAAPPQSAVEPAAPNGATTGAVAATAASDAMVSSGAGPATIGLPSTGAVAGRNDTVARLALIVAAAGLACIGASRLARAMRLSS